MIIEQVDDKWKASGKFRGINVEAYGDDKLDAFAKWIERAAQYVRNTTPHLSDENEALAAEMVSVYSDLLNDPAVFFEAIGPDGIAGHPGYPKTPSLLFKFDESLNFALPVAGDVPVQQAAFVDYIGARLAKAYKENNGAEYLNIVQTYADPYLMELAKIHVIGGR